MWLLKSLWCCVWCSWCTDLMKFLQWIDYMHSFWQEYVSRGCIHTDKMVRYANNSLLRDGALKLVISSLSSLLLVSTLSIKVGLGLSGFCTLGGYLLWSQALLQGGGPVQATLLLPELWKHSANLIPQSFISNTIKYYLKPFFGIRGQAFYVQQGASRWL